MDKILEALKHLLPEDSVKEVSEAVTQMLADATKDIESRYTEKLEEAYAELSAEMKEAEKVAENGYSEAWGIITDLRNRLEKQKNEFDLALNQGYEEAYEMLQAEKAKNESIASDLYEEYEKRLSDMKAYFVEKIDEFLKIQGATIYEQARRDVMNDPRMAEHKVALDRIVDIAANYLSDEDFAFATSSKLEEQSKALEQLRAQVKLLEGRNVKLSTDNVRLSEQVRAASEVISEARESNLKKEQKEKVAKSKNASGRGNLVNEGIIPEYQAPASKSKNDSDTTLNETAEALRNYRVLAGLEKSYQN